MSCSGSYDTLDSHQIEDAFIMNSSATFEGYFYKGTDNKFHYFVSKWLLKNRCFKLSKEELDIITPFKFGDQELRIDVWETNNKFGKNKYCELYICPNGKSCR